MNRKKLIMGLFFTSFLSLNSLKASLQGELVQLRDALTNLELKLRTAPPQPFPRKVAQEAPAKDILIGFAKGAAIGEKFAPQPKKRPQSVCLPRTPLSQSADIPVAKPSPRAQPLAQTTPPGGISVAQRRAGLEKETERPATPRRPRPQSARFERPPLGEPTKKTVNWVNLKNSIQQLVSLPSTGPEETARKKLEARANLDAINELVEKTPIGTLTNKNTQLWESIRPILAIDPLLIQSAINTLRKSYLNASEANPELYTLMTDLYENRIRFLENEFKKIKPGFKLTKGVRDDIDEGLTYPIEISGEVQDAQIKATKKKDLLAGNFFNTTNDQWERLLLLLRGLSAQQKEALKEEGIDIDQYINNIEENKLRAYCRFDPKLKRNECKPYLSFYEELSTMAKNADDFKNNKLKYNRSTKTFAIQNIINKLNAFAIYAQDPTICQICLNEDAQKANEETTEQDFNNIKSLFDDLLLTEPNNNTYLEALKIIDSIKADEAVRRSKIRKAGIGFQYQN